MNVQHVQRANSLKPWDTSSINWIVDLNHNEIFYVQGTEYGSNAAMMLLVCVKF